MIKYYTVYKVTNKINSKVYIGTHKTNDLDDNYMGSGKYLKYSQTKHGMENFEKEILHVFDNPEEMFAKEHELVNEEFIAETNTYNLKIGGCGGWDHINDTLDNDQLMQRARNGYLASKSAMVDSEKNRRNGLRNKELQIGIHDPSMPNGFLGKKHTTEAKQIIGLKAALNQAGEKNSQYGKKWIHSLTEARSTMIKKNDPIPEGWTIGRKMKF